MRSVVVISERYFPERFLINDLVKEWNLRGVKLSIVTQIPSYPMDEIYPGFANRRQEHREHGMLVVRVPTVLGYNTSVRRKVLGYVSFMLRSSLEALRLAQRADSIFIYHTGPLTQALSAVLVKLLLRKKVVIWTQDVWPDTVFAYGFRDQGAAATVLKMFVRLVYRCCDEVFVSSPGFVKRLEPYLRIGKTARYVPQWVPDEFELDQPTSLRFDSPGKRFIYAGNVGKMQNLENVIRAFGRVDPSLASFFILGDGSDRERLEALAHRSRIANVVFLGTVRQSEVCDAIKQCDFAVLPLTANPLVALTVPAKFQAYLSAGRPIMAVAGGETGRLVVEEQIGQRADPDDLEDIVTAIQSLASMDDGEREAVSARMLRLLSERYSKQAAIDTLTNCL